MAKKLDGVVEAVQYSPEGLLTLARVYERRGAAFSDRILLTREQLIQKLKARKNYVVGERKQYLAGTFTTGAALKLVAQYITSGPQPDGQDRIEAPLF